MQRLQILSQHLTPNQTNQTTFNIEKNVKELDQRGYTILKNIFTPEEVQELQSSFQTNKKKALKLMEDPPFPRVWSEAGVENRSQYWKKDKQLIMQSGKGRFDLYKGFQDGFIGSERVQKNSMIQALMKEAMVDHFTNYGGVVWNTQGSENQYWHRDVNPLQNQRTSGDEMVKLDDFYFTVLIPCSVDVTEENGPTEIMVGTHRKPAKEFEGSQVDRVTCKLGDALVFNGKCNHRGTANNSNEERPVIYQAYHKRWYDDSFRVGIDSTVKLN